QWHFNSLKLLLLLVPASGDRVALSKGEPVAPLRRSSHAREIAFLQQGESARGSLACQLIEKQNAQPDHSLRSHGLASASSKLVRRIKGHQSIARKLC